MRKRHEEKNSIDDCKKMYELNRVYKVTIDNIAKRMGLSRSCVMRSIQRYEKINK